MGRESWLPAVGTYATHHSGFTAGKQFSQDIPAFSFLFSTFQLDGVQFMHQHGIVHRDIKSENIFQDWDGKLFIGDHGFSVCNIQDSDMLWHGTWEYMAPEILPNIVIYQYGLKDPMKPLRYPYKADIWGLGCVLYELVKGKVR